MPFADWAAWYTAAVLVVMIVALAREVTRPELILLGSLGLLLVGGVLPPEAAFSGFSSPAMLTIAALYVVAAGVQRTNALSFLDRLLFYEKAASMRSVLLRMMLPTAVVSGFVNNTPLVIMLIPRLQAWASRAGISPASIMMPLSMAAVLGGMLTLIGTSTNLVVSGLLKTSTGKGLGFFDVTWVGLPAVAVGILYFVWIGHRLLPRRPHAPTFAEAASAEYHFELKVAAGSKLAGRTIEEGGLRSLRQAYLTHVVRGSHVMGLADPEDVLLAGDVLVFAGSPAMLDRLLQEPGLERVEPGFEVDGRARLPLYEAVVSASSSLVGKTLQEIGFRERFGGVVLAIQRRGEQITESLGRLTLHAGDLLLIEARPAFLERWNADRREFYLVAPCLPARRPPAGRKAPIALALFGGMVIVSALNIVPLVTASFAAAMGMIATRCLPASETRAYVDVSVLIMIAAALGIGTAVESSGLASAVADGVLFASAGFGPIGALVALYVASNILTEVLTNSAAAAMLVPVAIAVAGELQVDTLPFAVAVAIAASAGFATPFGYQTNLMVMGAGGYRYMDYVRAGLPMNVVVMLVAVVVISWVWL